MAFIHGWKAFTLVPAHDTVTLQDDEGGHLHNAISSETSPEWENDEGFKFYRRLEDVWRNTDSIYGHVTCLGKTIIHESGGRTTQYSVDYFLEAGHTDIQKVADKLNVAVVGPGQGCPVCRGDATEEEKEEWFGETYERPIGKTRDDIARAATD